MTGHNRAEAEKVCKLLWEVGEALNALDEETRSFVLDGSGINASDIVMLSVWCEVRDAAGWMRG